LGTCHSQGENFLWDLGQRKILANVAINRGPGMALQRLDNSSCCNSNCFHHARDTEGTISLHDLKNVTSKKQVTSTASLISKIQMHSQSFCTAVPCHGNPNLMAMPSKESSFACVHDWRISENDSPVALFQGAKGVLQRSTDVAGLRHHGMLMSLAMTETDRNTAIIACGMESW